MQASCLVPGKGRKRLALKKSTIAVYQPEYSIDKFENVIQK